MADGVWGHRKSAGAERRALDGPPGSWTALDSVDVPGLSEIEMRFQLALGLVLAAALGLARAEEVTVPVAVHEGGFQPAELKAPSGAKVRLEVTNNTAVAIEFESFELNRERVVPPGQKVAVYLSGLAPGRYEFFDDFHPERKGILVSE